MAQENVVTRKKKDIDLKKEVCFAIRMTSSFSDCWSYLSDETGIPKTQLLHWAMCEKLNIKQGEDGIYFLTEDSIQNIRNNFKK